MVVVVQPKKLGCEQASIKTLILSLSHLRVFEENSALIA